MNFNTNLASASRDRANLITFISSNDFDYLIGQLKTQLYSKSNILTRKLLVVPSDEPLRLFEKSCMEDPQIGMNFGYRAVNLNFSIEILAKTLNNTIQFPKQKALRQAIIEAIYDEAFIDQESLIELKNYLTTEKRTLSFFSYLARLFGDYAIFGMDEALKKEVAWQEILFNHLEKFFDWPSDVLEASNNDYFELAGMEVHLFGFSMIPAPFLRFFKKISNIVPVFFYVPTVTKEIATDFISDFQELNREQKEEKNSLLANFQAGTLGLWKFLIDESSFQNEFFYDFGLATKTLKEELKNSLLFAELPNEEMKKQVKVTDDFLFFEATTSYREVEEVCALVMESLQSGALIDDIAILAMDIESYGPLLALHMSLQKIPYRIDGKFAFNNSMNEELSLFIHLLTSRLTKQDLLDLLRLDHLCEGLGLDEPMKKALLNVIENSSITFAYNEEHRQMILENGKKEDLYIGTCCHFFDQMNIHLAFGNQDLKNTLFGERVKIPDSSIFYALGQLQKLLLEVFSFQKLIKTASISLRSFLDSFFALIKPYYQDKTILFFKEAFFDELSLTEDVAFDGSLFYEMLKEKIQEKKQGLENHPQGVFCGEFNEKNLLGKKILFILGADEENLPKKREIGSLEITNIDEMISSSSFQKGAFLLALGLKQEKLIFSYAKKGFDQQERFPSVFLQKFLKYLDHHFESPDGLVSEIFQRKLPLYPFLAEKVIKPHYDKRAFLFFSESTKPPHDKKAVQLVAQPQEEIEISIKELEALLKDPLAFFAKEILKIRFDFEEEGKEFSLAGYKEKKLIEQAIKEDNPQFFEQQRFKGTLPQYGFTKKALSELKQKTEDFSLKLDSIKKANQKGRLIIVDKGVEKGFSGKNNLIKLPALQVYSSCGKPVYIVGDIEELAKGVFFRFVDKKNQEILKIWPSILLYSYCSKVLQEESNYILVGNVEKLNLPIDFFREAFKVLADLYIEMKERLFFDFSNPKEEIEKKFKAFKEKQERSPYHGLFSFHDCDKDGVEERFSLVEKRFKEWFLA